MLANWFWPVEETTLSDQTPELIWSSNDLLHRTESAPVFLRQRWDEAVSHDFGPWRLSAKPDPLTGQTQSLIDPATAAVEPTQAPEADAPVLDADAHVVSGFTLEEVEQQVLQARQESWQLGHEAAHQEMAASLAAAQQTLVATAQALHELQADRAAWFQPLKKLSIHLAQELVRGEMKLGTEVIERLIRACIEALDQPAETTLVQVGHADMHRLRELVLPGIALELDETLSEGSVRAKVGDSQVQDLIEHRLATLSRQLLGETGS